MRLTEDARTREALSSLFVERLCHAARIVYFVVVMGASTAATSTTLSLSHVTQGPPSSSVATYPDVLAPDYGHAGSSVHPRHPQQQRDASSPRNQLELILIPAASAPPPPWLLSSSSSRPSG